MQEYTHFAAKFCENISEHCQCISLLAVCKPQITIFLP